MSLLRRAGFGAVATLLGTALTLGLGEGLVRLLSPKPRVQVVRPGARNLDLQWVGDVPVWTDPHATARYNRDCLTEHPDAVRIVVLGDSIFAGAGVLADEVWPLALQEALPFQACVIDLAESGYGMQNELVVAREALPDIQPDLVIWELWENSSWGYTRVGDTAYRFRAMVVGDDGTPNPLGLPTGLHRTLLPSSRLYELATLALADIQPDQTYKHRRRRRLLADFEAAEALTAEVGADMMVVGCPSLSVPFDEHVTRRRALWERVPDHALAATTRWAVERGHPMVWLDEALAARGEDHLALRHDACCHYSPEGHRVVAEVLVPVVAGLVGPQAPGAPEDDDGDGDGTPPADDSAVP